MPRWALGTVVVVPLTALLGGGRIADAVDIVRAVFVVTVLAMCAWLVLGPHPSRPAL